MHTNIKEKIRKIISEILDVPIDQVHDYSSFTDDLGADSLSIFEIQGLLEVEFNIQIEDSDIQEFSNINDVLSIVNKILIKKS